MRSSEIMVINAEEYITILLPQPLGHTFRYDEVAVVFHDKNGVEYVLYRNDFIIQALRALFYSLKGILSGNRILDESIDKDIGYLWNQYLIDEECNVKYSVLPDGSRWWIGSEYSLWNGFEFESWLYEKDSRIILEITPIFNWNRYLPEEQNQLAYEKFMSNYQPTVIRVLSKETILEWYKRAEELLEIIEANDAQYQEVLNAMPVFKQINDQEE